MIRTTSLPTLVLEVEEELLELFEPVLVLFEADETTEVPFETLVCTALLVESEV